MPRSVDPNRQPGLSVKEIFVLHARFEHKADPLMIDRRTPFGDIELQVSMSSYDLTPNEGTEPAAAVSVRVWVPDDSKHPYRFDVAMMAVVGPQAGHENFPPDDYIRVSGGTLLYPFLRELVGSLTSRGRFGPIWLRPLNIQLALREDNEAKKKRDATPRKSKRKT